MSRQEIESKPMSTETKHTPGPWLTARQGTGQLIYSDYKRDRATDCATHYVAYGVDNEANARLIASAPELLAALRSLLDSPTHPLSIDKAQSAIAKVEGRAQ